MISACRKNITYLVGSTEVGIAVGSNETTAVVGRSPIGIPVAPGARFVAVAMMLDTRSGSRADVGTIDGSSSVGLASMMLEMTLKLVLVYLSTHLRHRTLTLRGREMSGLRSGQRTRSATAQQ